MPLYRTSARIEVLDCSCICQSGRTHVYVVGLRDSIATWLIFWMRERCVCVLDAMQHRRSDQRNIRYSVSNIVVDMYDFAMVCFICADIIRITCQSC